MAERVHGAPADRARTGRWSPTARPRCRARRRRRPADGAHPDRAGGVVAGAAGQQERPPHAPARAPARPQHVRRPRCPRPAAASARAGEPGRRQRRRPTSRDGRHRATACRRRPTCPRSSRRSAGSGASPWAAARGAVRANISGSWLAHPQQLGRGEAGHRQVAGDGVQGRESRFQFAASAVARTSFHRMQGRSTVPAASSSTAPCIWPGRPMARTADRSCAAPSSRVALTVAFHQAAGSCSLQSGCGVETLAAPSPARATRHRRRSKQL